MGNFVDSALSGGVQGSQLINNVLASDLVGAVLSGKTINNYGTID